MEVLNLTADMIVTPGWRVIEREQRRYLSHIAASRSRAKQCREARMLLLGNGIARQRQESMG
jgi:hypothetical protein